MGMKVLGVIPARYGSTRLEGKPLLDIGGKPMIEHVYTRARKARCLDEVLVATDDRRIFDAVEAFGGRAVMTDPGHKSGTDRCAEVARIREDCDIILNIQGDEPLLDPAILEKTVAVLLDEPGVLISTAAKPISEEAKSDPNAVKVVLKLNGDALYFSRSLIPYPRAEHGPVLEHIGLYCYRRDFLLLLSGLPRTPLEKAESLEQLRVLEHGYALRVVMVEGTGQSFGVDTLADLERARAIIARSGAPN